MKRTGIRRGTSTLARRTPLRQRSARTAALYRTVRVPIVKRLLLALPVCERCQQARSEEVHEPLLRSRGGNPYDESQCVVLCHECHRWVHDHPKEATVEGWMRNSWDGAA